MYDRLYEEERAKNRDGLPRKWNHLEFLCELIHNFMGWHLVKVTLDMDDNNVPVSSNTRSSASLVSGRTVSSSVSGSHWKYWLWKKDVKPTCLKHLRFHLHAIVWVQHILQSERMVGSIHLSPLMIGFHTVNIASTNGITGFRRKHRRRMQWWKITGAVFKDAWSAMSIYARFVLMNGTDMIGVGLMIVLMNEVASSIPY